MKYAVLVYGDPAWDNLPPVEKKAFHRAHRTLHAELEASTTCSATVVAHYRLRPPQQTTTLRIVDEQATAAEGASSETSERLRALYVIESDSAEAVSRLAEQLPAVRAGGVVELWPVIEPGPHA
jgi:hypothetical protein